MVNKVLIYPGTGYHKYIKEKELELNHDDLTTIIPFRFEDERVNYVANEMEKIKIEPDALRLIATFAGGSYRDAESTLEQLRVWNDKTIVKEDIESLLGAVDFEKVKSITDCLNNAGAKEAIDYISKLTNEGTDLEMFTKALINHLRKIMLLKVDNSLSELIAQELSPDQFENIKAQSEKFSLDNAARAIKIFMVAQNDIKRSPIPSLPIELAVVEIISNKENV